MPSTQTLNKEGSGTHGGGSHSELHVFLSTYLCPLQSTLSLKDEIYESVFGASEQLSIEQYQEVFALTGNDVDSRIQQLELYGQSMEDGIRAYRKFANMVPGLAQLSFADSDTLIKGEDDIRPTRTFNFKFSFMFTICFVKC